MEFEHLAQEELRYLLSSVRTRHWDEVGILWESLNHYKYHIFVLWFGKPLNEIHGDMSPSHFWQWHGLQQTKVRYVFGFIFVTNKTLFDCDYMLFHFWPVKVPLQSLISGLTPEWPPKADSWKLDNSCCKGPVAPTSNFPLYFFSNTQGNCISLY
jgi:hypothetical protein